MSVSRTYYSTGSAADKLLDVPCHAGQAKMGHGG